jgi:RNA polymerase sigma-70 factor (ECF subfamily)
MSFADRAQGGRGSESDETLLRRTAAGDQPAFRELARRHAARALAVAQRIVGNAGDAEEVVQDALLRIWRHAPSWRPAEARVATWIYRIVVNLAIDRTRRRRPAFVSIDAAGDRADAAPDPHAVAEARELRRWMEAAIEALPERQRAALALCYFEEIDCAEAAAVMQISVGAMEALLVRARRTLRKRLDAWRAGGGAPAEGDVLASLWSSGPARQVRDVLAQGFSPALAAATSGR